MQGKLQVGVLTKPNSAGNRAQIHDVHIVQVLERLNAGGNQLVVHLGQVVAQNQVAGGHLGGAQLLQLQGNEAAVHAELQHVVADLADNAVHHLHTLKGHCHIRQGNVRLNLQGRQAGEHRTQTLLIAFKGLNRLVCASHQVLAVLDRVAGAVNVHRNHRHRRAHRNHRETGLNRRAFGGAVAGAGLVRLNGGVRHELYAGVQQAGGVAVADDSAIHLRQLAQASCRELGVDVETTRG